MPDKDQRPPGVGPSPATAVPSRPPTGGASPAAPDYLTIDEIKLADLSPRPVDENHVAALSHVIDRLPPLLVHRETHLLIDGLHRLNVFRRAKRKTIPVLWFDGSLEEAYLEAIRANATHGKPLTLNERKRAALKILKTSPHLSDRKIGEACALDHKTVGVLRTSLRELLASKSTPKGKAKGAAFAQGAGQSAKSDPQHLAKAFSIRTPPPPLHEATAASTEELVKLAHDWEQWWHELAEAIEANESH